jgi:hypothetical protein
MAKKTAKTQSANEQLETARRELRKLRRWIRFGSWLTTIVALLLLGLVAWYFTYGYLEISALKDPEMLVSLVGQTIDQSIPQLRQRLEQEVDNNAKAWAQQASEQALAAAPTLRENLEDYICKGTDLLIDELEVVGEQEFRRVLAENRATLEKALEELEDEDEISDGTVLLLEEAMEKELQLSMQDQAQAVFAIVSDLNASMKTLAKGEDLNEVQQCERRVLMLARRLQLEHFGDVRIEDLAPKVLTEAVEKLETERLQQQTDEAAAKAALRPQSDAAQPEADKPDQPEAEKADKPEAEKADEPKAEKADEPKAEKPTAEKADQ